MTPTDRGAARRTPAHDRTDVLVMGPAYCDVVFAGLDGLPELGTERFAGGFLLAAGGSAITAIALARLGRRVALLADVGDDPLGRVVQEALRAEGVETRFVRVRAGAATPVTAVLSTPADRAFVTWLPQRTTPPDLPAALRASGARHLHIAGFPAALARPDLLGVARDLGATVSFDPGWDERALAGPEVRGLAVGCDVLLPNLREATRLADRPDGDDGAGAAADALERLAATRPDGVTVVKDGARGAVGRDPRGTTSVPAPRVDAVDPTGAGDVFDAGFLDAWLAGRPLAACLARGAACGALAVTASGGATAAPRRDDLDRAGTRVDAPTHEEAPT